MKKRIEKPKFKNESAEADWWASAKGRNYVEQRSAEAKAAGIKFRRSPLLEKIQKKATVQIALRLPQADLAKAREIAEHKGIGYQTLIKMLVHEGLRRHN